MEQEFVSCKFRLTTDCYHSSNPIMIDIRNLIDEKAAISSGFIPDSMVQLANDKLCKKCVRFEVNNDHTRSMD